MPPNLSETAGMNSYAHAVRIASGGILTLILASCASTPSYETTRLEFLVDGATTRAEIVLHLGEPARTFERES